MSPIVRTKEVDLAVKMSVTAVLMSSPRLCPTITCDSTAATKGTDSESNLAPPSPGHNA